MQISLLTAFAVEGEKSAEYFPIGMKWKEVLATPGIPLDTITATLYEIGGDTLIGTVRYKEVFRNNKRCKLWIREEGQVVWLLTSDYPTEIKLYDFDWDRKESTVEVLREYGENFELCSASINFEDRNTTYTETFSYEYISKHDGTLIRGVGRVSELNRDACLLGYKLPEVMLPGLEYHKILWITRDGETVFRSNDSNEWIDSIPKLSESDQIIDDRFLGFMLYKNGECSYYTLSGNCTIDGIDYIKEDNGRYCYRQDGNRVYCYSLAEQKEYLVMDFGLKVGDVFPLYEGFSLEVEMISDTLISSDWGTDVTCKRLHLRGVEQPAFRDMWVEGFGSVRYGINPPKSIAKLLCSDLMYAVSGEFIYMVNFSRDDKWGLEVPLGEEHPNTDLPYPPYEWQNDSVAFTLSDGRLNIDGYVWNDCFGPLYMLIREEGETITINTYELPDYADCYSYYKTNVTVAGLDQDRYTLLYNGKNLELAKDSTTVLLPAKPPYLVTDGLQWAKCSHYHTGEYTTVAYELRGDTIIGGESYKKEWQTSHEDLIPMELTGCFMREEAGKVYRKRGDSDEYLWFDYKASVGDTIFYDHSFAVVTGHSDTTIVCNGTSRTYNGVDVQVGSYADSDDGHLIPGCVATFYEGLGLFTNGDIASDPSFLTTGSRTELLWVKRDGALLYLNEEGVFWKDNTSIEDIESLPNDTPYYDLQGRKVVSPTRGIYIRNGRKVVIK